MFRENKTLSGVVVEIDLDANTVLDYYGDYLRLVRMNDLFGIYKDLKDKWQLLCISRRIKKEGLSKEGITDLIQTPQRLTDLKKELHYIMNLEDSN